MTCRRTMYPFSAIVGQERMKKALILNAVNPRLGGVLIRGEKGTAKSTAVRALANLLPVIDVVEDCRFQCNPDQKNEICSKCLDRIDSGLNLSTVKRKTRVVDLPLGATEDRVIGTLDIEHAIKKGEKKFETGILASAHRGILYVDEVNLLDDHLVDILLDVAAMGVNYVEREGVSYSHPAKFILIGTMNPEEGELRPQLLDRFGLCVDVEGIKDQEMRIEVVERHMRYEESPHTFESEWEADEQSHKERIIAAQKLLPEVTHSRDILGLIASIAIDMGVDSHRADIAILKAARTLAAWHERVEVTEDDVKEAAELVLSHRMRKKPFEESDVNKEKLEESIQKHKNQEPKPQPNIEEDSKKKSPNNLEPQAKNQEEDSQEREKNFASDEPFNVKKLNIPKERKIQKGRGRRSSAKSDDRSGHYVRSRIPKGKSEDIAFDATFRAAAPYQSQRNKNEVAIAIHSSDIRDKVKKKKIGTTILFVVDSSGSMGAKQRMSAAKGAILSLLMDAYQKRDRVGLIAFKGNSAEIILQPTTSVEQAKKCLEELPTGGKTPLGPGLLKAYDVFKRDKNSNKDSRQILVLISDGRLNVGTRDGIDLMEEVKSVATEMRSQGITSIVLDTETGLLQLGKMKKISDILGGIYFPLDEIKAETISNLVSQYS